MKSKVKSRVLGVWFIMLMIMLGVVFSIELNTATEVVEYGYTFMEVVGYEGAIISNNDKVLRVEVDGVIYAIEVNGYQTLFAVAEYDKYSNDINMLDVNILKSLKGKEVIVYSGSEVLYKLIGNMEFDICEKDGIIMVKQTNKAKLINNFAWE